MLSKRNKSLHVIKPTAERPPLPYFRAGEPIPDTGIYRVFHAEHRLSHEVTLLSGESFPRCSVCKNEVHFELLISAPQAIHDSHLRGVRLYEIPHPHVKQTTEADEIVA